ncbi:hypothetical protein HK103_004870 [Boothiomyces macroporosus]|uniref:Velvet domain-containing protein n=1 Tax=Boothiomyces macroporosus TaxID=261099 RepID=A0AAD5UIU2_9FUNG|nr:hypothetical protein HK103_004870 [Boothiomyces macroporosus]
MKDFRLAIRQQPLYGRESGIKKPFINSMIKEQLEQLNYTCFLYCLSADKDICSTITPQSNKTLLNNFDGDIIKHGHVLKDPEDGQFYLFFVFPDVNIKVIGEYVIRCCVIEMVEEPTIKYIDTQPFEIIFRNLYKKPNRISDVSKSFEIQGIVATSTNGRVFNK